MKEYLFSLTTEMIAGSVPDVLEMEAVPIALTDKNFSDLKPYLENDTELGEVEFEQSVLPSMLMDEKLFVMPSSFYLQTVVGRTRDVDDYHNWTTAQLYELLQEKGEKSPHG